MPNTARGVRSRAGRAYPSIIPHSRTVINRQIHQRLRPEVVQNAQNRIRQIAQSKMHKTLCRILCNLFKCVVRITQHGICARGIQNQVAAQDL